MLLCISSFRKAVCLRTGLGTCLLLLILALLAAGLEATCRLAMPRISRIERRTVEEHRGLLSFAKEPASGFRVIVLGNSLLDTGIQFDEARRLLSPEIDARRWVVHNTSYFDWYYGQRRLFAEGCRPDVVVLVLTARQLSLSAIRGSYFGYHLMKMSDLLSVANDVGLSNTETSGLAFANASAFFGLGGEARKWLAGKVIPDLPRLTNLLIGERAGRAAEKPVESLCLQRLRDLRELAAQHGAGFVLVIPPTPGDTSEAECATALRAGALAGVSVLNPLPTNSLTIDHYSDGFHLNERGAELFTRSFVEALRQELGLNCRERAGPPGAS